MIFDSLDNLGRYACVQSGLADVQTFIATTNLTTLTVGKHPITVKKIVFKIPV